MSNNRLRECDNDKGEGTKSGNFVDVIYVRPQRTHLPDRALNAAIGLTHFRSLFALPFRATNPRSDVGDLRTLQSSSNSSRRSERNWERDVKMQLSS